MWLCGSPLPDYIRSIRPKRYLDNWSFLDMDIYMYWEFGIHKIFQGGSNIQWCCQAALYLTCDIWHVHISYLYVSKYNQMYYLDTLIYITMSTWVEFQFPWPFTRRKQLAGKYCTHIGTWCKLTSKVVCPIRLSRQSSHDVIIPKKHEHYNILYPWGFLKSWGIPSRHHGFQYKSHGRSLDDKCFWNLHTAGKTTINHPPNHHK